MAGWLEFSMAVAGEAVEPVAELFARLGDGGVAIEEPITPVCEEPGFVRHPDRPVVVRAFIAVDDRTAERRRAIEEGLWHLNQILPLGAVAVRRVDDADWEHEWKRFYTVFRIGRRCVVKPHWLAYEPQPDDVVLDLDPGMAFGTGQHPTTAHCLEFLEAAVGPGMSVLDIGTGSGILTIAALKLGAAAAVALDVDPIAVRAARENLALNGLSERVIVERGSLPHEAASGETFDLVVANLVAGAIIDLAPQLALASRPGGAAIVSGIIASREAETLDALARAGLALQETKRHGDWRTFLLTGT